MKILIHFNSKGNEVITEYSFDISSCLLMNNHHYCMCYHRQYSMNHICASWINNDNIRQSPKIVSGDKDIHSLSGVVREKVGNLFLNMCSTLQIIVATISRSVSWVFVCSFS
jgi:hypothetical protein